MWEDNLQLTVLLLVKAFCLLLFLCFFSHCTVNSLGVQRVPNMVESVIRENTGAQRRC